jgi:hypothetical protein
MGLDNTTLDAVLMGLQYSKKQKVLTLGRQLFMPNKSSLPNLFLKYGLATKEDPVQSKYCELFFKSMGIDTVESIDASSYEDATHIHDFNHLIPESFYNKYDTIIDGGTIEHIFNIPHVLDNIINMLSEDGIFISVTCNNNFSGHGFYQFSPEIFLSSFTSEYGMKIEKLYLAKNGDFSESWIDVNLQNSQPTKRVETMIPGSPQTYIICIARKVSNIRKRVIEHYPQQFSYAEGDWKSTN